MKYLCLGYLDVPAFTSVPEAQRSEILEECFALCVPFRQTGKVVEEEGLVPPNLAKSIRRRGGRTIVTDGPFLETKEQLGSFFVVEADSIEEAVRVASLHPAAMMGEEFGFGVEVRPFQ